MHNIYILYLYNTIKQYNNSFLRILSEHGVLSRVADPDGNYPDPEPTVKKNPDSDPIRTYKNPSIFFLLILFDPSFFIIRIKIRQKNWIRNHDPCLPLSNNFSYFLYFSMYIWHLFFKFFFANLWCRQFTIYKTFHMRCSPTSILWIWINFLGP